MTPEHWQKVKSILEQALENESASRADFLQMACHGDENLRGEIELLLEFEDEQKDFLEQSAFSVVMDSSPNKTNEDLRGRRIGNYKLIEKIGSGGMGDIFSAERADGEFSQRVALKLLKRGMDSEAILRYFHTERQILANLNHPNIARLLDGGTTADGVPYFVMEYVEGKPLDEYCDGQKLSINKRLELFRAVCSAVAYAHESLVIHRDIKPSNILVTADGTPKLLDFGISKILQSDTPQTTQITETGFRAMTPEYASPEQIKGESLTTSSDIYSLAVVLYEMLTGRSPYKFKSRRPDEMAKSIGEQEPERPSAAITRPAEKTAPTDNIERTTGKYISSVRGDTEPEKLRRRLRGDLDNIVLTALSKSPTERYASVTEFSADIERHLQGLPVHARGTTMGYRGAAFFRRTVIRNWRSNAALLLLLIIVAATAFVSSAYLLKTSNSPATNIKSIAVLPFKYTGAAEREDNLFLGVGLADYLITKLGQTKKLEVRPMSAVQTYSSGDVSPRPIGESLAVDAVLTGNIKRETDENISINAELVGISNGNILWKKTFNGQIQDIISLQNQLSAEVSQILTLTLTESERETLNSRRTINAKAYDLYVRGRYFWNLRNKADYEKAIEYFKQAVALDPNYADGYAGLSDAYALLACVVPFEGRTVKMNLAKDYARRALSLDETLAAPHATLGFIGWHHDWDWETSDREFKRAIELNPSYATAHQWYALLLIRLKRFDEAVAEIKRAGSLDPLSFAIQQDYMEVLFVARRYDEAIEASRKSLEMSPAFNKINLLESAYYHKGDWEQYFKVVEERINRTGRTSDGLKELANIYLRLDRESDWQKIVDELKSGGEKADFAQYKNFKERQKAIKSLDKKNAFDWLDYEYKNRGAGISAIHIRPEWDELRNEPRIQDYIRGMNLSEYMQAD